MGLLNFIRPRIYKWSTRKLENDLRGQVAHFRAASAGELAVLIGCATYLRLTMDQSGELPKSKYEIIHCSLDNNAVHEQIRLSVAIRQRYAQTGDKTERVAGMILLSSLRAITNPELRPLANNMWKELERGREKDARTDFMASFYLSGRPHPDNFFSELDYVPAFYREHLHEFQFLDLDKNICEIEAQMGGKRLPTETRASILARLELNPNKRVSLAKDRVEQYQRLLRFNPTIWPEEAHRCLEAIAMEYGLGSHRGMQKQHVIA